MGLWLQKGGSWVRTCRPTINPLHSTLQYRTSSHRNAQSYDSAKISTHTEIILLLDIVTPDMRVQIGWKMLLAICRDWNIAEPE